MGEQRKGRSTLSGLWKLVLAAVGVAAVVQELRKPSDERTWHGHVGVFPYDFRVPTLERVKNTYWNPNGPLVSSRVWGVGWALNLGAVKKLIRG